MKRKGKKCMKKVCIFLLLALFLTACNLGSKPSNPQVKIETSTGREFKVVLDSNPSTGYHWEIVGDLDPDIVEFVSRDYRADKPLRTGSGGSDIFIFKAVGAGETTITLGYYPPSNDATEPNQQQTFTVVVK
jgi:predicted secreted protein